MAGGNMNVRLFLDLVNRLSVPAKAAQKDLKGVGAAAKDLKKERGGEQIAKDLVKAQQAAKGAGSGLKEVTTAARSLKGERAGDQLAKDLERATKAAARAARELKAMKVAMREMAKTTALVNMTPALTGRRRKSAAGGGENGAAGGGGFGSTAKGAAVAGTLGAGRRALAPVAAGVGAYGAVRGSVGNSVSFEKEMAGVKIKLDGMDDPAAFAKMETEIRAAAIQYARTREEVAKLVAEGGASGITKEQMPEFIKLVSSAAAAWDQSAEKVSNSLAKIKASTGATLPELKEFGDLVNAFSDAGASKEMDVVDMFQRANAAAKASGIQRATAMAFLTAGNSIGMEPEVAARGFNSMAGNLAQATEQGKDFQKALKGLGLEANKLEKDFKKDGGKAFLDVFERLNKHKDKGKIARNLFGKEWWDEALKFADGLPEVEKYLKIAANPAKFQGSMDNSLNIRLGTTAAHLEKLKTLSTEVGDRLGRWTLPHINDGIQKLVDLLKEVDRRSAEKKTIEDTAEKLATDNELSPDERRRMAEDGEYKKAVETNAKRRKEEIADQKVEGLKKDLKRGVSEDDGDVIQSQRRREIERLRLDREIEDRQKNLAIRDPKGRDATHLGERRKLESLKQQRKELGASEKPMAPMAGRSDAEEAKSKAPFSAQFNQEQEIEALRRKITVLQELSSAATNARDKMAFLADTIPVTRRLEKVIAPNATAANRFKLGKTGAGKTNEVPAIPRGPGKFGLGGPATAGGTGGEDASATPNRKEVAAKWKNVAKASAEDLKAAFNIDLGVAGMTMMERLAAGITSGASRVDGASEAVGNGVKTKLSAVDLNGAGQQMMQGLASGITAGGAQAVAAAQAVANKVRSTLAGVGGNIQSASARSTSSAALHDGVA